MVPNSEGSELVEENFLFDFGGGTRFRIQEKGRLGRNICGGEEVIHEKKDHLREPAGWEKAISQSSGGIVMGKNRLEFVLGNRVRRSERKFMPGGWKSPSRGERGKRCTDRPRGGGGGLLTENEEVAWGAGQ